LPFDRQNAPEIFKKGDFRLRSNPKPGENLVTDWFFEQSLNLNAKFWVISLVLIVA